MIGVGQQLGGYTILHKIGQGGMGDVYFAQHRRVARRAAVKVLLPELSQKATVLDRFFNEARATSLIKHPGIVEILDCDVLDDQAFIIMEYLEGESLGEYLNRTGALGQDLPFLLGVATSIAGAVGAAHATGIIHRDLKPDNVYLHLASASDPTVTVKILDFGIAKLAQQEGGTNQTKTGMLLGTPAYMSPEQCRGAGQVDLRSDIYSLGCILYELVCGAPPFVREGAGDMIIAHVSELPEPPINRVPGTSPATNALILRMLSKKPEQRPQTMDDVAVELATCAATMGMVLDKPLRPRLPVERPTTAAQFSSTQVSHGGIPRSQVTPLPGSGGIRAPSSPSLRPVTPYGVPAKPAGVIDSGRVRVPTGSSPDTSVSAAYVGGTRVMEAQVRPTTTMGSAAAEVQQAPIVAARPASRGKMFALAGGAVVVIGVIAIVATRGNSPHKRSAAAEPTATGPSVENVAAPIPPAPSAAAEPPPVAEPPPKAAGPSAPALPDTVRIDLQGMPARTAVTLDGRPASLPLQIARGPQVHRIVLKPPSGAERTLEVDGSKDRLVELMFDKHASSSDSPSSHSSSSDSGRSSSGSSHGKSGSGKKKPAGSSDRDAITDI